MWGAAERPTTREQFSVTMVTTKPSRPTRLVVQGRVLQVALALGQWGRVQHEVVPTLVGPVGCSSLCLESPAAGLGPWEHGAPGRRGRHGAQCSWPPRGGGPSSEGVGTGLIGPAVVLPLSQVWLIHA